MLHFGRAGDSMSTMHGSSLDALLPWGLCPSSGRWNSCFSSPLLGGLETPARAGQLPQAHAY